MNNDLPEKSSDILLWRTEDSRIRIKVRFQDESVWLSLNQMAELFQRDKSVISRHIRNIFKERELQAGSTVAKFATVQSEGSRQVSRVVDFYNLDVIISVGYRVKSHRGTQFRIWATQRLREFIIKGFTLDDERLKEGRTFGVDYFDELLERIRDIRASEKRFYRKITDIYKLSVDYDPNVEITLEFFATVQNKLHWAITGHTAAELIAERVDATKPNMGLTSWKGAKVRKGDVTVAKNYLTETELRSLNRIVTMYLDYAEDQAERHQPMYMRDWKEKIDAFLQFNDREILDNPGTVSAGVAKELAMEEYEKFSARRLNAEAELPDEDFERVVKKIEKKE